MHLICLNPDDYLPPVISYCLPLFGSHCLHSGLEGDVTPSSLPFIVKSSCLFPIPWVPLSPTTAKFAPSPLVTYRLNPFTDRHVSRVRFLKPSSQTCSVGSLCWSITAPAGEVFRCCVKQPSSEVSFPLHTDTHQVYLTH